jgi:RimJ/RimL family protein N-acetyltransferase
MIVTHQGLRVRLRSVQVSDLPLFKSEMELSPSYLKRSDSIWLPHHDESIEALVMSLVEANMRLPFPTAWVIENENMYKIGLISLHSFDARHLVFSYGISLLSAFQGRGYAYEAVNLLLHYMFNQICYFKCLAKTYSFNNNSIALQQKVGFKMEGILKESYFINGKFADVFLWGIDRKCFLFMHKAQ